MSARARLVAAALGLGLAGLSLAWAPLAWTPREPGAPGASREPDDPLASELARLSAFVAGNASTDALWLDVKEGAESALTRSQAALADGRRLLALQRLAAARLDLDAAAYLLERPAEQRRDEAAFEAEVARVGAALRTEMSATPASGLDALHPVVVRALAESAICEAPILLASSLDYGRATDFDSGLFYLGQARGQLDFARWCRALPADASPFAARPAPPLRDLAPELDALEAEVLAAYRPPAAIERHPEFITVSALVKTARELNDQGQHAGALLKYLHAVMRFAPLRAAPDVSPDESPASPESAEDATQQAASLAASLEQAGARFAADDSDQSLGALFVETGQADLAAAAAASAPGTTPRLAAAIVSDVLPRYADALGPAPPVAERPAPELAVTLVRWPFT